MASCLCFPKWRPFRRSSLKVPNAQFVSDSPRRPKEPSLTMTPAPGARKSSFAAQPTSEPPPPPSPSAAGAGGTDSQAVDDPAGEWWRQSLLQENRAGEEFQAVQMERMRSIRASGPDPSVIVHVQTGVWLEETRKVTLSEFLAETPGRYGAITTPFPNIPITTENAQTFARMTSGKSNSPQVPGRVVAAHDNTNSTDNNNNNNQQQNDSDGGGGNSNEAEVDSRTRPLAIGTLSFDKQVAAAAVRRKEAQVLYSDLTKLLQSPLGLDLLGEFMTEQMCAENLIFHEATNEVEQSGFPLPVVRNLVLHFISHTADAMVNINGNLSRDIEAELGIIEAGPNPSETSQRLRNLLLAARQEIFTLMNTDIFPRFLESEASKPWRKACELAVLRADGLLSEGAQDGHNGNGEDNEGSLFFGHLGLRAGGRRRFASMLRLGSGLKQWGV